VLPLEFALDSELALDPELLAVSVIGVADCWTTGLGWTVWVEV
jgi:hypothetical protein